MRLPASLKQAIGRMSQYCPWYMQQPGTGQEREAGETDLESLPLMTASVLEAHYYTDSNPLGERSDVHCYRTSGTSSGRRKAIYYTDADEEAYIGIKLEVFRAILGTNHYRTALADMGTGHAEATAVDVFRRLGIEVESISFRRPIEEHLERLAAFRPEVLYTMPSILERLLQASANPAGYGIRHVILVGEIASPVWIGQAARRLGLDASQITDTYGSIEIGTIAYFSHEHGRYVLAEGLVAEGIAPERLGEGMEPLESGDEQVLVLSSAVREAFPAMRYVTYDVVRDLRPIRVDGVERQSFKGIVKRIGPDLKHGEKISIYDIEEVVFRHLSDARVRVKVTGNALVVHVYSLGATAAALERIRDEVENRIPEIGTMIRARILGELRVERGSPEMMAGSAIKSKKIFYE
ncbi:Fumarate--(S)-2,3-diaminopropanoate ligase [Paenibacillus solanacearum]|uniref:Fumarate--(S)-2,3-diaminopropanoate ligase n=1 Tax=Paenibacillus solanacearum TaxID=2048548 RepID=A0A916NK15_9BACL|nr:CoF synthetase [Paenibacillus solanacearum]CAG7635957.1 Fumarate--(S)-2,3-diaminopropanoate ligase [Paenibacillus solanacearum]